MVNDGVINLVQSICETHQLLAIAKAVDLILIPGKSVEVTFHSFTTLLNKHHAKNVCM